MLKPFRVTGNLPGELTKAVKLRMREEKYPSLSAYIIGLVLFDLHSRRPHLMTGPLMREPEYIRDSVILELAKEFDEQGAPKPGGWFEHRIQELLKERHNESRADS